MIFTLNPYEFCNHFAMKWFNAFLHNFFAFTIWVLIHLLSVISFSIFHSYLFLHSILNAGFVLYAFSNLICSIILLKPYPLFICYSFSLQCDEKIMKVYSSVFLAFRSLWRLRWTNNNKALMSLRHKRISSRFMEVRASNTFNKEKEIVD